MAVVFFPSLLPAVLKEGQSIKQPHPSLVFSFIMATSDLGCAQNPDGSLRDASEIEFFNDVDDTVPISGPSPSASRPVHPLFTKVRPFERVAGVRRSSPHPRRSSRTSRPSARAKDPNNAEAMAITTTRKRKADDISTTSRKAPRKQPTAESSDDDSEGESADDAMTGGDTEAEDTEGQDAMDLEEYESFKSMGDTDHQQPSRSSRAQTRPRISRRSSSVSKAKRI
ncbi:hypothetical protein B0H13DRAFT_2213484 [Mycena leptocephala]|nr:hypothetical protein B0H13DRAFT_2213484 [Mycena leptocephala]